MLEAIRFILNCIIQFSKMLFNISIGSNMSLGLLMCILFIFLPIMLRVVRFLKQDALEELDDQYDESRPLQTITSSYQEHSKLGNGKSYRYSNTITKRRRYR